MNVPERQAAEGPSGDRAREEVPAWFAAHPVVAAEPALADLDVLEAGRPLAERALAVLAELPAEGVPLPVLAARVTDDPHALDEATPLADLVLKALALLHGLPEPRDAESGRLLWDRAGVACDGLSTTVLVAGLHPAGEGPLAAALRLWGGVPNVLTLDQVRFAPSWTLEPGPVWVVENPAIVGLAARRFGPATPPLVCSSGWPNSAVILLLRRLAEAGARLRYHGDFDAPGLRIASHVLAKTPATPWRMSSDDYLRAVAGRTAGPSPGKVPDVPWSPGLGTAMRARDLSVPEESVADVLLEDLALLTAL